MDPAPLTGISETRIGDAGVAAWRRIAVRAEDWLLAGWIVIAAPILAHVGGTAGPFDSGHPVAGLLQLAGFAGALACLATRSPVPAGPGLESEATAGSRSRILDSAAIGPLVGGLLLVGGTAFAELGLDPLTAFYPTIAAVLALSVLQSQLPRVSNGVRRALVTPYLLAAGGIFWSLVRLVTGGIDFGAAVGGSVAGLTSGVAGTASALILGAAVYYAMLIYAPRQVAEREGGPVEWLARFALFVVSVALGLGWLSILGG
ncbi:MAG: hypothetical protein ACHQ01_03785 [Candidatus Limnocylindrales bacterium]